MMPASQQMQTIAGLLVYQWLLATALAVVVAVWAVVWVRDTRIMRRAQLAQILLSRPGGTHYRDALANEIYGRTGKVRWLDHDLDEMGARGFVIGRYEPNGPRKLYQVTPRGEQHLRAIYVHPHYLGGGAS